MYYRLTNLSSSELSFENFAHQGASVHTLIDDLQFGRFAPVSLVVGKEGVGKKSLIFLLANALLCTATQGKKPCGHCKDCLQFIAGTHDCFLQLSPTSTEKTIKIDAVRTLISDLQTNALSGGNRVIYIKNAHILTPQAQNALLKTLEETQENTFFFLSTAKERSILPTIRSRCRTTRMKPFPTDYIEKYLIHHGHVALASQIAKRSEGSLTRALQLLNDEKYKTMMQLALEILARVKDTASIPQAVYMLKDCKDDFAIFLDCLETEIRSILYNNDSSIPIHYQKATEGGLTTILQEIVSCQEMMYFHVNWQAIIDKLLLTIAEEVSTWQQ